MGDAIYSRVRTTAEGRGRTILSFVRNDDEDECEGEGRVKSVADEVGTLLCSRKHNL